jgi:3-mercaptopropionate dioxygenase
VWRSGQVTRIHDHVTWCVVGVIEGVEREKLFTCPTGEYLLGVGDNAKPGGFGHRVRPTDRSVILPHIYGTDVARIGSSVQHFYDVPVRSALPPFRPPETIYDRR